MQKADWQTIRTPDGGSAHILPVQDVIVHRTRFTCPCNPQVEARVNDESTKGIWVVTHNSFDEYLDESETEPYKGL